MKRYPVYETFHSWQGEGVHLGRSAFFIRTFGCPVHCPWCDSAGTWHPDQLPEQVDRRSVDELVVEAEGAKPDFVVITGGEPAIHDLAALTRALHEKGLPVHLETSGAFELKGDFDWVTVSPKRWRMPLPTTLARASELKLILERAGDLDFYWSAVGDRIHCETVWLHPEWSRHADEELLQFITETVKERGSPFRAGWQLHKLYQADRLDIRSRPDTWIRQNAEKSVRAVSHSPQSSRPSL